MGSNAEMPKPPRRRYRVAIEVEAHTLERLARDLLETAEHAIEHGPGCNLTSGGGRSVLFTENAAMTRERFEAEESEWAKRFRAWKDQRDYGDPERCAVCGRPLAESRAAGCVRGGCSATARPEQLYAPKRAKEEARR